MDELQSKLYDAHVKEADRLRAEFYNLGWAMGDDFIHSKTSEGRLFTEIDANGNVKHEWQKPKKCVICHEQYFGFGNNPAPVKQKGQCCDNCNATRVIPARLEAYK